MSFDGLKFGTGLNENATKTVLFKTFQYASRRYPQESRNAYQKGMRHLWLIVMITKYRKQSS